MKRWCDHCGKEIKDGFYQIESSGVSLCSVGCVVGYLLNEGMTKQEIDEYVKPIEDEDEEIDYNIYFTVDE